MKKIMFLVLFGGLAACQSESDSSGEIKSKLVQTSTDAIDYDDGTTTLSFDKMEHDFGDVRIGQEYTYKFVVKNTGKKPLTIEDAKASCGCTVPEKPQEPIAPGKTGEIVVTFSPKPGQGVTSKTVTVTANTDPAITTLTIRANVIEDGNSGKTTISVQ